jgi:putative DNA primase/helicase
VAKNEQSREANQPIWFDGKSINEALFCDDFLSRHKIIYTNGAFFTPDGRVTDDLPLRSEIFDELRCCAVSNIPRKISNIVELMKLAALLEDFPPEADRIHLANGTLMLDGSFTEGSRRLFAVVCRWPTIPVLPHQPAGWRFWMGCFTRRTFRLCRNISATA